MYSNFRSICVIIYAVAVLSFLNLIEQRIILRAKNKVLFKHVKVKFLVVTG